MLQQLDNSISMLEEVLNIFKGYSKIFDKVYLYATLQDKTNCFKELNKLFSETEKHYHFLKQMKSYKEFVDNINDIFNDIHMNEDLSLISQKIKQYVYQNDNLIINLSKSIEYWKKTKEEILKTLN